MSGDADGKPGDLFEFVAVFLNGDNNMHKFAIAY